MLLITFVSTFYHLFGWSLFLEYFITFIAQLVANTKGLDKSLFQTISSLNWKAIHLNFLYFISVFLQCFQDFKTLNTRDEQK